MNINPIKSTQIAFRGLFTRKPQQDPVIKTYGEKVLNYEVKNDVLFVKDKPYTGRVRLEYKDGRKEHRDYEEGRVMRSDLNGDGRAKMFYTYKTLPSGQVRQIAYFEGDDGIW